MLVKIRIQNPNDLALDFSGVAAQMDCKANASPLASATWVAVCRVLARRSMFSVARQAFGVMTKKYRGRLAYEMTGKLAGPAFNSIRFTSKGELTLPAEIFESGG